MMDVLKKTWVTIILTLILVYAFILAITKITGKKVGGYKERRFRKVDMRGGKPTIDQKAKAENIKEVVGSYRKAVRSLWH